MSEILAQQRNIERKRSLDRTDLSSIDLRRENQGKFESFSKSATNVNIFRVQANNSTNSSAFARFWSGW